MGCSPVLLKWFFHLSLFTAFSLLAAASESDKSALVEFKSSIYDPSGVLSGWNSGNQSHCLWYGVMCDLNSRVVGLNISGGGEICAKVDEFPLYGYGIKRNCEGRRGKLVGKISSSISRLSEIRVLSLAFNEFSGEIPCEIWGMEKLEVLDLEGNLINGSLPVRFDGLRRLRVLNLGFNKIEGEIPDSLSGLAGLEVLNLAGNRVNGSVPGWVGWVRSVYLSFNRLGGSIPVEIGKNCAKLEYLDLSSNYLVHTIPGSLGNCSQMRMLLLYSNMLDESIPFELGKLKNLEVLDLSRNTLSGPIPPQLGNCSELSVLVLKNLFDPAPRISRDPSDMEGSSDSEFNLFEGGIPTEIAVLPKLEILWAPRANLEGNLTRNWGACDNLEMVNLAENCFTGDIPAGLSSCKKLQFLDLSSNRLNGELNDGLPVACMNVFDVSGNRLMGSIPKFDNSSTCAFAPPVTGMTYNLSEPAAAYRSFFYSQSLKKAPLTLYNGANSLAVFHNFGSNLFSGAFGSIPLAGSRLGKETVYAYSVGGNGFTGSFPVSLFEKCDELGAILVNVSNNKIFAQLPPDIGSMCSSLVLLDASRNQIDGSIPPSLGSSESLVALNLSDNLFRGQIPSSLSQARSLKNLSLANNKLTGIIPPSLVQLHSLEVLELSSNGLSGVIPKNLVNMKNLTVLLLDNNKLSGKLPPELSSMTALASFNVSFNNLSGPIPSSSNMIKCSSFVGNHYLEPCPVFSLSGPPVDKQGTSDDPQNYAGSPSESLNGDTKNVRFNSIEIAAITSASAIFSVLVALTILFIYTRKCSRKSKILATTRKELTTFADIGVPLTFETVVRATGNFNVSNCIGHGGFGATYKAEIAPGVLVAVKRLSVGRFQGVQQFHVEIKTLGRHRHPNLVTLIGYHASETEMFLIYNFLPGGNLEKFIQERSTRAVDWRILHKIALDIARALAYLHDECVPRVLHRDVKPSNILLDEDLNAYLSDFGLARLLGTSETHATTGVAGTFGYVAPEYAMTCRVSDKADVYSYGVVLLELLSDKKALDPSFCSYGYGFNIVHWASMLLRQGRAKELFTAGLWDKGHHDDLVEVLHLAVVCTEDSLSTRPTMRKVVRRLKELQPPSC